MTTEEKINKLTKEYSAFLEKQIILLNKAIGYFEGLKVIYFESEEKLKDEKKN